MSTTKTALQSLSKSKRADVVHKIYSAAGYLSHITRLTNSLKRTKKASERKAINAQIRTLTAQLHKAEKLVPKQFAA